MAAKYTYTEHLARIMRLTLLQHQVNDVLDSLSEAEMDEYSAPIVKLKETVNVRLKVAKEFIRTGSASRRAAQEGGAE